jgi:Spy/CpxP family protein refolding chaperone
MHQAPAAAAADPAPGHDPAHHAHAGSPYADKEGAEVKAISAEDLKEYREGTGMGLAKPAELNHYPGPRHALDMAGEIGLTENQTALLRTVFDLMHANAIALGEKIITEEKTLDRAFASANIDDATLRVMTERIGKLQAELRTVHLAAHLETRRILTAEQVARYDRLRGYAAAPGS